MILKESLSNESPTLLETLHGFFSPQGVVLAAVCSLIFFLRSRTHMAPKDSHPLPKILSELFLRFWAPVHLAFNFFRSKSPLGLCYSSDSSVNLPMDFLLVVAPV